MHRSDDHEDDHAGNEHRQPHREQPLLLRHVGSPLLAAPMIDTTRASTPSEDFRYRRGLEFAEERVARPAAGPGRRQQQAVARWVRALADPVRVRPMSTLLSDAAGEACTCRLAPAVGLADATVSHHLGKLRGPGWCGPSGGG
jgi:hypothetical protein